MIIGIDDFIQAVAVGFVAFLYAAVGHGGATGYISVLTLLGEPSRLIATTALIINTVVSTLSFANYARGGHFIWKVTWPFLISSIPASYLGALMPLSGRVVACIMGGALLLAALRFLLGALGLVTNNDREPIRPPLPLALMVGGLLGLLSGMIGIGGGVFLSPVIIFARWASTKQSSATAALFILVNSLAGLAGRYHAQKLTADTIAPDLWLSMIFAIPMAYLGAYLGASRFSSRNLQILLALVLMIAAIKLFVTGS